MEAEEAAKSIQAKLFVSGRQQIHSPSNIAGLSGIDWSILSNFVFDPGLLADFRILENVEILLDIRSSS